MVNNKKIRKAIIVLLWLCVWQVAALVVDNALLLAGPVETIGTLFQEMWEPVFWQTIACSLVRILGGFLAAFVLGSLLGIAGSRCKWVEELVAPLMLFCKAVPVACFAVMLLIWWGAGRLSGAVCFFVTLPLIYTNVLEGIKSVDRKLLQMAEVFDMPFLNRFFYIYRPAVSPFLESGLKTALGMGIKAGVAAEVIGLADCSIGGEIYMSKIYLDTAGVFAWTFVVVVLGAFLEKGALGLWKAFCKWKPVWKAAEKSVRKSAESRWQAIALKDISKTYGDNRVLDALDKILQFDRVYGLMAPSGAGKTTLLHLLAGVIHPDNGIITGLTKETGKGTERVLSDSGERTVGALKVSMVFQEDRLCEAESALTNVEIVCGDRKKAKRCLEALLLKDAGTDWEPDTYTNILLQPVSTLSGGMRRRVCLARALTAQSDLLLLDEPFNGLDINCVKNTAEIILRHREGRLLVVATHHKEDVILLQGEIWEPDMPKNKEKQSEKA